ncbi:sss: transporter, solute:sodium symporter (SSS) family [Rubrobacter radiotolerans]|uniref:Cation acetate symporter n=1 Tax=Rubrobacter radiotolerans TaxID=42256 RepID=A0A023X6L3_RUBRA|nr:cation acetate symporter [Rubrobacter radiotolerans]AHY47866.1 sss: transporter, solute:sodium symporter (SSS) family [Rubrobacter radiotolerans]MDX5892504.1 cation acetate symporter [Rubrobacter radiotolerans]SMC07795.1 cation/acetate symporter [Rubrobacter radiotolerans DSM 5868]
MQTEDVIALVFFGGVIALTLAITYWAAKRNTGASSHYVAGGQIKGWQNGLAISGDYLSAASFLGIAGAIALSGFSGFYLSIGFLVAYLVVLLLVAEPLRNLGKYTLADMLTTRFNAKGVRATSALNTITISTFYMIAQLVGAGALIGLLLPFIPSTLAIILVGILMTIYVVAGGMVATTWIQIIKAVLLITATVALTIAVLAQFSFNPVAVFNEVQASVGQEAMIPPPPSFMEGVDTVSLFLALVLGTAGLPHILIRFLTVPDAKAARSSIVWATWIIGGFYLLTPIIGYGATLLVGRDAISAQDPSGNVAAPQLANALGGPAFLGFIAAVAFATIVAVVAGLVISASGAFAHDFYNNVIRSGQATEQEQFRAARIASAAVAIGSIVLALAFQDLNVAFLVALAFGIAASANVPVILLTIFWRKFNTVGAVTGMLTGLISAVGLTILGPNILGDAAIYPFSQPPAIFSVPLGFLGCFVGTLLGGKDAEREMAEGKQTSFDEIYVRAQTGFAPNIEEELEEVAPESSRH